MNFAGLHLLRLAACLSVLLCTARPAALAEDIPPENFALVDSLLQRGTDTILTRLDQFVANSSDSVYIIDCGPHPAGWLLKSQIVDNYDKVEWQRPALNPTIPQLTVNILRCGVQLRPDSTDTELLHRYIDVHINASLTTAEGRIVTLCEFRDNYTDSFSRQQLDYAQTSSYSFAYAEPPEPERNFFDEVVEPLVAVSAAVVTVVLLFTVRSQ